MKCRLRWRQHQRHRRLADRNKHASSRAVVPGPACGQRFHLQREFKSREVTRSRSSINMIALSA
eukprot:18473-Heterococcus_DN1.PRE.2